MNRFAFIIHPIDLEYITKNIKILKYVPGRAEWIVSRFPSYKASEITGWYPLMLKQKGGLLSAL